MDKSEINENKSFFVDKNKLKKKGTGFVSEFKEFIMRGNVMDMAIGVIIGAAFGAIVTSFTESFINPLIACIGGTEIAGRTEIGNTGQYLEWGNFITAVINFLIMAFCIFLMLKGINKLMAIGKKKEEAAPPKPAEPSKEELLLTEIRDLLKEQANK